ncbi:MAG TPA: TonB-dependent receptor [Terriglobales bacterium]|nr:TonB-dependent receptor [Terriglobales bacterium]
MIATPVRIAFLFLFLSPFLVSRVLFSQQTQGGVSQTISSDSQTVVVTGTFEPIPLSEANRAVISLDTNEMPTLYNSVVDYLSLDPSIDLQQRGQDGVQADLSIRGATFEQSLVLLNGLRINDAQSGHHDMDIPLPLEAITRIEVLHGAGSTLYGADALGGAVNFITGAPTRTEIRSRIGFGNFGFNQQGMDVSYLGRWFSEQATANRDASSGFQFDRDYQSNAASSETRFKTALGATDILLAGSDRPFGADQFYGDFPSWERTKSWFASISQTIGKDTDLAFGYRRHSDEFVLVRDDPSLYENNHISQSWQADARRKSTLGHSFIVAYGLNADGDEIDSNNLGHHARNRGSGYVNFDVQSLHRLFLSLGAREEIFSGGRTEFAPTLAGSASVGRGLKLRASASRAFRLPTFTDLYYSDPANLGNPLLKPESAWSFEAGPEWNLGTKISTQLTVFNRREQDDIDYVRGSPDLPWQAVNIPHINFTGVETAVWVRLPKSQTVQLAYTALEASQQVQPELTSKYVFNYPTHNALISWSGQVKEIMSLRTRVGVTQRVGQDPYAIWDLAVGRSNGTIRPFLQLSNLSDTTYQEIPGIAMQGRSINGGVEFVFVPRVR